MKALIQRVTSASVSVNEEVISSIGKGLCVFIGICVSDTKKEVEYIAKKILKLRLFDDDAGKRWGCSVSDKKFEILCISQFTLYSVLKGNKPDFHRALAPEASSLLYQELLNQLGLNYDPQLVKDGKFGAYMKVNIQNDGPVTIEIESLSKKDGE